MELHDVIGWLGLLLAFVCAIVVPTMIYEWLFLPSRAWLRRLRKLEHARKEQADA